MISNYDGNYIYIVIKLSFSLFFFSFLKSLIIDFITFQEDTFRIRFANESMNLRGKKTGFHIMSFK